MSGVGYDRLWGWFGLSYSSFLTLPRILMHEMPDEWQAKMTDLLEEYEDAFPGRYDLPGTRVQAVHSGRIIKFPSWLLNYRRPDQEAINCLRAQHNDEEEKLLARLKAERAITTKLT